MTKRPEASRLRQQLSRVEEQRDRHLTEILQTRLRMIRGSFVVLAKKCGKPNCRCSTGETHPTSYLSISEEGRKRMVHVRAADVGAVREAADRYRRFREARAALSKLSADLLALVDVLQECLVDPYPPPTTGESSHHKGPGRNEHAEEEDQGAASGQEGRKAGSEDGGTGGSSQDR
ncbi:MAG: hypothetical protein HY901_08570 [Deltaproteobacteria bacterium]|nr:hypothetical protein [Deltaproteobacteria bacterium]